MNYRVPKGQHYAWPPAFGLYWQIKRMHRVVTFDITAKYDLPGTEDDEDVNKLFGWGYLNGGHHKDSARFGWNYNNTTSRVALWAYCYINGERVMKWICEVPTYLKLLCQIDKIGNVYSFTVADPHNTYYVYGGLDIRFEHNKKLAYKLSCFFGGNNPAPHDITIKISKK